MKVLMNSYPVAFACPGGGEIQFLKTKESLEALGTDVELFNQWEPQFDQVSLSHYFSVQGGSMNYCHHVKHHPLPLAISPILWPDDPKKYPVGEITRLLEIADVVLPNSQLEAEKLSEVFGTPIEKFHVTYNGIDDRFIGDNSTTGELFREKYDVEDGFLLCVANVEERKNQLEFAKALKGFDRQVVLVGHVRSQDYLDQVLEASDGRFKYIGPIPHESELLRSAYRACDLFVLPSILETPGLAALEAAAMGCRVAVTEVGATKEYFEDYVSYLDPFDHGQMRSSIEQSLSQPVHEKLKYHVSEKFTWANTAKQCLEAYHKIV